SRVSAGSHEPEHTGKDAGASRVLLGQLSAHLRMLLSIPAQLVEPRDCLLDRGIRKQSRSDGEMCAESCVLGEHRTTGCEIAATAIAEPAATGVHVAAFRHPELTP